MPDQPNRVCVERVDWLALFPFLHLFRGFRMALHPGKLLLALLMVLGVYLGGLGLDLVWGPRVHQGELDRYLTRSPQDYAQWVQWMNDAAAKGDLGRSDPRRGIFQTILEVELDAFQRLVVSATSLNFGVTEFLAGQGLQSGGVLGSLLTMIVVVPGWLYRTHPGFLAVFLLWAFLLTALFGGAISRLAALQACRDERISPFAALRFVGSRYPWFVLAPVIPLVVALLLGLGLALVGVLFNWRVTDVLASLIFGLLLLGGVAIALTLIGLVLGSSLLFPAMAVEGADAFDAISRAFNYLLGRPWRFLFYWATMLVYGAVTYLFVGLMVYFSLWTTKAFVGWWVFSDTPAGVNRFDAIFPSPRLGELMHQVDWSALEGTGTGSVAAALVLVWVKLVIALLPAFAVSFYFCEQTWIYLLLRRWADGAELDEVYLEPGDAQDLPAATEPPDKLEPATSNSSAD